MKQTGLIMSTPMMIADLKNLKTQTRRTWGLNKINESSNDWQLRHHNTGGMWQFSNKITNIWVNLKCPYGEVGDLIWIKERYRLFDATEECSHYEPCSCMRYHGEPIYYADQLDDESKWKSSMFMKREYSRRSHILSNVRCERVQDITLEDCWDEGIHGKAETRIPEYKKLWDTLNAKRGYPWSKNVWCWILEWELGK